jgi:DNA-binding transcriptional MerR regulator
MLTENEYSLQDLAGLAGVSPRTIRYYVAQGLLPSPGQVGPGARYTDGHLARLRLIRRLQREHLPLAEIRTRLAGLDDPTIAALIDAEAPAAPEGSALDYIRSVLDRQSPADRLALRSAGLVPPASRAILGPSLPGFARHTARLAEDSTARYEPSPPTKPELPADAAAFVVGRISLRSEPPPPAEPAAETAPESTARRSQWDRIALSPDIELNIRRPLSRQQNKRVERLIAIAHELLEEDPS